MTSIPQSDSTSNYQVVIYETPKVRIPLRADLEHHTVWVTQRQIADALDLDVSTVSRHVQNFKAMRGETANQAIAKYAITAADGKTYEVEHYNMTVVTYVGFRAQSDNAQVLDFQEWVGRTLDKAIAEKRSSDVSKNPPSAIDVLENMVHMLREHDDLLRTIQADQAAQQTVNAEIKSDLAMVKANQASGPQMMTALGYAKYRGLALSDRELQGLGQRMKRYSEQHGLPVEKVPAPNTHHGVVNAYHMSVLELFMGQRTLFEPAMTALKGGSK